MAPPCYFFLKCSGFGRNVGRPATSQQFHKFVLSEVGLPQNGPQHIQIEVAAPVERNDGAAPGGGILVDTMGAGAVVEPEPELLKDADDLSRLEGGRPHARASSLTASRSVVAAGCSIGISSPSLARDSMSPRIASRAMARVSRRVSPCVAIPRTGIVAT